MKITSLHTLGPEGTNCQKAAQEWYARRGEPGGIVLHPTLEAAVEAMPYDGTSALLGCVVYPDLHTIVFGNLHRLELSEVFVVPTHHMVLAARSAAVPALVATHPAPQQLVPAGVAKVFSTSNTQAATECAAGAVEGCITTDVAAARHGLNVLRDFGPVSMGFTVHVPVGLVAP
ncbi:MAG: hypothetical protein ACT4RN_20870 [Pseudonocardia sp.]